MCRLYGFISNHPRKVECELVESQNGLMAQSREDERGESNPDGWGLGSYKELRPNLAKQTSPAYESEDFRWAAADVHSTDVMAHVRRATIGSPDIRNTHPFQHDRWLLSHNGHLDNFDAIRERMLDAMSDEQRHCIGGTTDSEHVFHLLLTYRDEDPDLSLSQLLKKTIRQVRKWSDEMDPTGEVALNLLLTDGERLAGSRLGRSLWYVTRHEVHPCEVCGERHVDGEPEGEYRAVVVASERITSEEEWTAFEDGVVFEVDEHYDVVIQSL